MKKFYFLTLAMLAAICCSVNASASTVNETTDNATAEEPVTVTLTYAAGIEDCLNTIYNHSTSKFLTPVNNQIEAVKGNIIQFNFKSTNGGFSISDILVNDVSGKNIEGATFNSSDDYVSLKFAVNESLTLKIEGAPATYADIPMTAYVMNPQGVVIKAGQYGQEAVVEATEAALTQSINLPAQPHYDYSGNLSSTTPSYTLTSDNAKVLTFNVQDRNAYNVYVEPAEGWYIATLRGTDKTELDYIDKDYDQTLYVVALPLTNDKTATIRLNLPEELSEGFMFSANQYLTGSWNNPSAYYTISNGTDNTVTFTEGYQSPFTFTSYMMGATINCKVDERVLTLADPESTISYSLDLVDGSVAEISTTDYAAGAYPVTVTTSAGETLTYTYGTLNRTGESGYKLLSGTSISVRPGDTDCRLTVNDAVVYSPKNNVNLLTDGAYTFTLKEATTISAGPDAQFVEITKPKPFDGQCVRSFESLTVSLPALGNPDNMFAFNEAALSSIKVTATGGKAVEATFIEPMQDWQTGETNFTITFETIDEPGNYTITIPAGFFFETAWDENSGANVAVEGGLLSEAFSTTFTIDPNAPSFILDPANNSTVSDLSKVRISFPDAISYAEIPEGFDVTGITLTGAGFSTTALEVTEITDADYPTFDIVFDAAPSAAGEYTLTLPAGAFSIDGYKESEAYTAVYNFKPAYVLTPAPGSTISELNFTISFPQATEVAFTGNSFDIFLTNGSSWAAPGVEVTEVEGAAVPTYTIALPADAEPAPVGNISLTIFEGAFTIDGVAGPEISATYNYEVQVETTYQVDPATDFIIIPSEEWGMIMWTFLFDEAATVQGVNGTIDGASVTVNGEAVGYEVFAEQNMLMMNLASKEGLTDGDVLRVQIPAGAFTISGQQSPAIDHSWTLYNAKAYTWTSNPADGSTVATLDSFTLTFVEEATGKQPTLGAVNEGYTTADVKQGWESVGSADVAWVKGGEFKVTLKEPVKTAGQYTVNFNYGAFRFDERYSFGASIAVKFTVDPTLGITDISVNGHGKVNVVTLDGRVINNADINTLPAGIYIINGKKTLIK